MSLQCKRLKTQTTKTCFVLLKLRQTGDMYGTLLNTSDGVTVIHFPIEGETDYVHRTVERYPVFSYFRQK